MKIFKQAKERYQIDVNTQIIKNIMLDYQEYHYPKQDNSIDQELNIVKEYYGIQNQMDLFRYLLKQEAREIRKNEMGETLKDPRIQATLSSRERKIAKELLFAVEKTENYGGVSIEHLANQVDQPVEEIRDVIEQFISNYWVIETDDERYLPRM